jgi:hypothetical protein
MHYEEIQLNFDASCQQIIGLESEILWEALSFLTNHDLGPHFLSATSWQLLTTTSAL